jgi:DNA-binding transcriptional LysR family regulator
MSIEDQHDRSMAMHESRSDPRFCSEAMQSCMAMITRWDDLRVLLAVLRAGSFSAAARTLAVEQSTVSRRIAALEGEVGTLFDRSADGLRATALAERMRGRAELVEREVLALTEERDEPLSGRIALATTESFAVQVVIPRLLGPLREQLPELSVDLVTSDLSADLGRREAELALRFYRPTRGDLVAKRVARLPRAVLGHQRYLRGKKREARAFDWVTVQLPGVGASEHEFLARHARVEPRYTVSSHLAQVELVRAGLAVALLSRALTRYDPQLAELDLGLPLGPAVELWLVTPRSLRNTPKVAAVWDILEALLVRLQPD